MDGIQLFDANDQKVRDRWLLWCIKIPIFIITCIYFFIGLIMFMDVGALSSLGILSMIGLLALTYGSFYIPYYCAYEKYGTAFLTFTLVCAPLLLILNIHEILSLSSLLTREAIKLWLNTSLVILNFYFSYKLREINKKAQKKLIETNEDYLQSLSIFQLAPNLEALEEKFANLMRTTDNGRIREYIAKAYEFRKKDFLNVGG